MQFKILLEKRPVKIHLAAVDEWIKYVASPLLLRHHLILRTAKRIRMILRQDLFARYSGVSVIKRALVSKRHPVAVAAMRTGIGGRDCGLDLAEAERHPAKKPGFAVSPAKFAAAASAFKFHNSPTSLR